MRIDVDPTGEAAGPGDLLHEGVTRTLGIEIIDGVWEIGQPRTLEDIQGRFNVSRTVAREAARQLETMGLVRTRRRHGLVAQEKSLWHVLDSSLIDLRLHSTRREEQLRSLTHLRLAVEPAAAEGAARNGDVHARARLMPLASELRRLGEAGELTEFLQVDIDFHRTILALSGNELFAALSDVVAVVLTGRTELGLMPPRPQPKALDGHEAVAEAIFRGDPATARFAMQAILDEVRDAVVLPGSPT